MRSNRSGVKAPRLQPAAAYALCVLIRLRVTAALHRARQRSALFPSQQGPLRFMVRRAAVRGTDERSSLKRALRLSKSKNHFFAHSSLQL